MILSTELFVMVVFIIGFPLFTGALRGAELPGSLFFILSYLFLLLSNIFTVIEEFCLYNVFNTLEHLMIAAGALMMLIAVWTLTKAKQER